MFKHKPEWQIEQEASDAEDKLAVYRHAKREMVSFLHAIVKGMDTARSKHLCVEMLDAVEWSVFNESPGAATPKTKDTAESVIDCLTDSSFEGAYESIDDHFHAYLAPLRELAR